MGWNKTTLETNISFFNTLQGRDKKAGKKAEMNVRTKRVVKNVIYVADRWWDAFNATLL